MAKKEKEKPVLKIDDKEYYIETMTDPQKAMVNHIADLDKKVAGSEFNLVQLRFGRQAFVDGIRASLENGDENK